LNKSTSTWVQKKWNGIENFEYFYGEYIWSDGDNIYYSFNNDQYILDKSTSTWNTKTWNINISYPSYIWTDADGDVYYSYSYNEDYILNKSTLEWEQITFSY
jgi:hypothetical protein